jgi:3-oxoacyl-[acyl-carrier-protein] synthase III
VLTVEVADEYPDRALICGEAVARQLAAAHGLDLGDIGALVASASTAGFAAALAERLGVPAARVASIPDELGRAHTAGLAAALDSVTLADAGTALLVSVGAGLTVATALYRA